MRGQYGDRPVRLMPVRRIAADGLLVAAAVLLIATALGGYAWRVLFDSDEFSARATVALQDPSVRELIAERVTDELVRRQPDALAVRPAVVSAVSGVVGGAAFASLFRSGVRDVHGAVFRRNQNTVTLTVADVGLVAAEALRLLQPQLASELEAREPATLVDYDVGGLTGRLRARGEGYARARGARAAHHRRGGGRRDAVERPAARGGQPRHRNRGRGRRDPSSPTGRPHDRPRSLQRGRAAGRGGGGVGRLPR